MSAGESAGESAAAIKEHLLWAAQEMLRSGLVEGTAGSQLKPGADMPKDDTLREPKHYGLHRHFTGGSSVVLFGGGMKRGHLHGETAPERPLVAIKDPVTITDLHATIFTAMGISPKTAFDVESRPFYATSDGLGKPVKAIFA